MSDKKQVIKNIAGTFLIDATAAFLNGAGMGAGENKNKVIPKTFSEQNGTRKEQVPYVSAQSFRRWLRNTANEENQWAPSELRGTKTNDKGSTSKIATELNPIEFPEDDIFGYMSAGASTGTKKEDKAESVQRTTAFKNSILRAIRGKRTLNTDEGFVHLKDGSPLPYSTQFYSAYLEGFFNLECYRLGVYDNLASKVELSKSLLEQHAETLKSETIHKKFTRYILDNVDRLQNERAAGLLRGLAHLRGGAKQAAFATDVSPKVIILAGMTCANPVFNDLFIAHELRPTLKVAALKEIARDYVDKLSTPIYVGIRTGLLENEAEVLALSDSGRFVVDSPINAVRKFNKTYLRNEG